MYLHLGQLIYTSFAGSGFKTLASAQVPRKIQQAFTERIVTQYWDAYNPPAAGYRAVYLYQINPDQTLFGWLYNDGTDDIGRSNIPYFICYYLAEPLLDFQLANIFTCLEKGPVGLIDRHNVSSELETKVLPDLWSYQPARTGVSVPLPVQQHSYIALRQGELLELFVPVYEQETVIVLSGQTYEQQIANLSIYARYVIDGLKLGATINPENATTAQAGSLQEHQSWPKLQIQKILGKKNQQQYPLKVDSRSLLLRANNAQPIQAKFHQQTVALNTAGSYKSTGKVLTKNFSDPENLNASVNRSINTITDPVTAYRKSQLLLKIAIAATVLALAAAIYGLQHQATVFNWGDRERVAQTRKIVYETLAEVPNVPRGVFRYGGSTTFAPLRSEAVVGAISQAQPQFQLHYFEPASNRHGSTIGIQQLLAGYLNFAQSSRPLKSSELQQAQQLGFTLEQIPVAIDGIAFYANPQVNIPGLNLAQIRGIFTGKIDNWKQLGGPDLPITPFSLNPQYSGTAEFLQEKVLAGEEFGANVQLVETTTNSIRLVARTPGGIGYATASQVINQKTIDPLSLAKVNTLPLSVTNSQTFVPPFDTNNKNLVNITAFANGSYPLTRNLFIIVKRDGGIDEQAGIAYANLLFSKEGQRMVEQAGFVPMH